MTAIVLIILACVAIFSFFSKAIGRTIVTLPMIFVALGLALSEPLRASVSPALAHDGKILLGQITLILVLYSDASHVQFRHLAQSWKIPARMLVIGLPLTILLGTAVAYLLNPGAGLAMSLLTAALLTPTDAALGQTVVSSAEVPEKLSQSINVESGLNDGLVLPFILIGAIFASAMGGHGHTEDLAVELITELALAPFVGVAIGWGFAKIMDWANDRGVMNEPAGGVAFLCAAFIAYLLATFVHANGFIAAFVAGMVFGNVYRNDIHFIGEFMEGAGQILTMMAFLAFGAFLLPDGLAHANGMTVVLAVLFLTVVRILPIFISLAGSGLSLGDKLFLGWFGPRGLASILFTLLMMDAFELQTEDELLACVSLTVALSIVLHGVSAAPLVRALRR
ncbi:MAG: cation:proton antiporter [Pseudomonadota bacterium]